MHNKVFISYATEDYQYADKLHGFLSENGFDLWMDKKNLSPGQNWLYEIQIQLRKADFVILFFSHNSVNKRSTVQKEFNLAMQHCEERLDSDIYIIPVKIDDCEPSEKFKKFQWVDYNAPEAFDKILKSLNIQRSAILKEEEIKRHKILGFEYLEKEVKGEYGNKSPRQLYEINYPIFKNESNESLKELNIIIQNCVVQNLIGVRHNYYSYLKDYNLEDFGNEMYSTEYSTIQFQILNNNFISFTDFLSTYDTGAAHGNYGTTGHNYLINPLRKLFLYDLFKNLDANILILRDAVHSKLMAWAKVHYEGDISENFYMLDEGLEAKSENFDNFYFKENALVFIYNPYHLTAWCYGDQLPEITFDELKALFPNEKKLHEFIEIITAKN